MRALFSSLVVVVVGACVLTAATDGFQAFTLEEARRYQVTYRPQYIPDVELVDSAGRHFMLSSFKGQQVVVEFIYTGCQSFCVIMAGSFGKLQSLLQQSPRRDVRLLTISFSPADGVPQLAHYAQRMKAEQGIWTIARLSNLKELPTLLDAFGIVVIPGPTGDYEHNAALHLLDAQGRLGYIGDYDKPEPIAARLGLSLI